MARRDLGPAPSRPSDTATVGYVNAAVAAAGRGGIALDTDGVPYFTPAGPGTIQVDTDGVPYYTTGA